MNDIFDKFAKMFFDQLDNQPVDRQATTHVLAAQQCLEHLSQCIVKHGIDGLSIDTLKLIGKAGEEMHSILKSIDTELKMREFERVNCVGNA